MIEIKQGANTIHKVNGFTFSESDMGDASINLILSLPASTSPAFSKLMRTEYKNENFYLTTTEPQASKDVGGLNYNYTLLFDSERSELKRRMVRDLALSGVDTYVSQGLVFGFNADLNGFCGLLQRNLNDCFGNRWIIDINPEITQPNSARVEVSNSYIWDLLLKMYELYGVRWKIAASVSHMVIKVGYPADAVNHVFEYGSDSGLTRITRENQNAKIVNRLRGTGGTRNLPVNYFTDRYTEFAPDPNPIQGSLNFKNLMPKCFRDSVIAGGSFVDFIQDDALVVKNGVTEDGLEPNEEIYPSIEGAEVTGLGRIDEIVYAEKIEFDSIDTAPESTSITGLIGKATVPYTIPTTGDRGSVSLSRSSVVETAVFGVTEDSLSANLNLSYIDQFENVVMPSAPSYSYSFKSLDHKDITITGEPSVLAAELRLVNVDSGLTISTVTMTKGDINTTKALLFDNLTAGNYKFILTTTISGTTMVGDRKCTCSAVAKLTNIGNSASGNKQTFDIWVKDIQFDLRETDSITGLPKYAGLEDAKIAFKSGDLAGYEFVILQKNEQFAVELDNTKSLNGVQSKYRITLIKSEDELEASGKLIPNTAVHAYPHEGDTPSYGDKFVILGIQMPHDPYVLSAEQRLQNFLIDQLELIKVDQPTYTIEFLDKFLEDNPDIKNLIRAGNTITISDPRLIDGMAVLYINTLTVDERGVLPKYTVTITNKITVNGGAVQRIQSQIDALFTGQYQATQSSELAINALDSRYIRKTVKDIAYQPIEFRKDVTISTFRTKNFTQGQLLGSGGAMYNDVDGSTVLEVDRLRVRREAIFNDVVINQIKFQGGIVVYSAANMEVSRVEKIGNDYRLFFDMKGNTVHNQFVEHDIIKCQRFSSTTGESKYYSTIVTDLGADFIDISNYSKDPTCILNPEVGDQIVQFGHVSDINRQSVIEVNVLQGGKQTFYQKVNTYDLTDNNYIDMGMVQQPDSSWSNMIRVYGDAYIGARNGSTYIKYNEQLRSLEIRADVSFRSPLPDENGDYSYKKIGIAIEEVADNLTYKVEIISTNGTSFRNDNIATTLIAVVYHGKEDVTAALPNGAFRWVRKSDNPADDLIWNAQHATFGSNVLNLDSDDVEHRAVFNCQVTINN